MHSHNCAIIIILCETLNIRALDWYFADKPESIGNETHTFGSIGQSHLTGIHRNYGIIHTFPTSSVHQYHKRPGVTLSQLNQSTTQQGNLDWSASEYTQVKNKTLKPITIIHYNNNLHIANKVKRLKPKRQNVQRRCKPNQNVQSSKKKSSHTAKNRRKFLDVFEVVQFENVPCTSSSGLEGRCLHEYECQSSGGAPMGTCADGYGICCVTQFLCDGQSSEPLGWFTNPGFPSPSADRLSCTFTLHKASADISQIRLDFATFELLGPNDGTCQQDQFVISGQNLNSFIPILCGINTGQHVYIEVGETEGPLYMSVQTISTENRLFSIKVTQLTTTDNLAAPTGCLQYFTEKQGILESFNYREKSEIGIPRVPSYFNNLNYAICILRARETCSVTYTNADFMQIVNYDLDGLPVIPKGQAGVEIFNCPGDWLLISATRLCGERFNDGAVLQDFALDAPVTDSNAGPIAIWFRTDEGYAGRGFKLQYQQNACNGPS